MLTLAFAEEESVLVLIPEPTADPNDPLVSSYVRIQEVLDLVV